MKISFSRETGAAALKAVVIVFGVILFALLALMFGAKQENEKRATELQESSARLTQTIAKQEIELKKLRVQVGEIARMRRDNEEIHKLRAQAGELSKLRPEHQRLQQEVKQLQARVLQVQSESAARLQQQQDAERARLLTAATAPRLVEPAAQLTAQAKVCIANLKQIDGAKQQWAIDNRKNGRDVPTGADLFGLQLYLKREPICPLGARYQINSVSANPTCSHPEHKL